MLSLEDFYYQKLFYAIDMPDRFNAITIIDDVVVINFDTVYERECAIRGMDQLIYLAHKHGKGKRFLFISEDGANIAQSGALIVINNIINCFNLNQDTCAIVCRENITVSDATVIVNEAVDYWCRVLYPTIKSIPIYTDPFRKKFACWFNRGTVFRFEIAQHLHKNYKDESYISYQEKGIVLDRNLDKYFDTAWANGNTPIIYDKLFEHRVYTHDAIVGENRKQYRNYFIEIIVESDILSSDWITEKTVKNLYVGKPFIVMCAVNTLKRLHSSGFKTFSPWIDESYDSIENIYDRLEAIKQEVDRLAQLSLEQLHQLHLEMLPVLEHNRKTYESIAHRR